MTTKNVTVGVMARAPLPGRCKTRLAPALGAEGASTLYRAMLLDTLDALDTLSGIRKVVLAAPEDDGAAILRTLVPASWRVLAQRGRDLGERLANGFTDLGDRGDPVVLVSSDSPILPAEALSIALSDFAGPRRALLGPCEDGGYYLLGLTVPTAGVLRDITWSTPLVLGQTRDRLRQLEVPFHELPVSYDVDTPGDLDRLRTDLAARPELAPRCAALFASRS
jgi:uncharacterized protein